MPDIIPTTMPLSTSTTIQIKLTHTSISSTKPLKISTSYPTILTSLPNSIHNILPYKIETSISVTIPNKRYQIFFLTSAINIKIPTTILTNIIQAIILIIFPTKIISTTIPIINQTKIIPSTATKPIIYPETTIQTCITTTSSKTDILTKISTTSILHMTAIQNFLKQIF